MALISAEHPTGQSPAIDKQLFCRVCGKFASGITIPTVLDGAGTPQGLTANSFTSVSLTPPMVLICVDHRAKILEHFRVAEHFGINVLQQSQRPLSERFAGRGYDRFEGVEWYAGQTGVPLLPDSLATIECKRINSIAAGDHEILIGEVLHAAFHSGEPLVYFASQYCQVQELGKRPWPEGYAAGHLL